MFATLDAPVITRPIHSWLKPINVFYAPGDGTPLLAHIAEQVTAALIALGHTVQTAPDESTDVIFTAAPFGAPLNWRKSVLFTARKAFNLDHTPTIFTLIHARPAELEKLLAHFETVLKKDAPDPADYDFPGLAPTAYTTFYEQGRRGGPMMAVLRLLQAQAKSIRIALIVGDDTPQAAYHIDLVGAHPRVENTDLAAFYTDIALRFATAASTREVTKHQVIGDPIPHDVWQELQTPQAMKNAGHELGHRHFFTQMISIPDLVQVPALADAVSRQYSEGCFATWDPTINALVTTITGSARPVDKGNLTDDEMAVIDSVRPDGLGAQVRQVEGKRNDSPSSEAVELRMLDSVLPQIHLTPTGVPVPVVRSKLHGHRGIGQFNPNLVEFVPLEEPYYHYLVSCSTEAQAFAIRSAFSKSQALQNPSDPRQIVFTVLPGHGCVITEKWRDGKAPFQTIWEAMDSGDLHITNGIPQGPMSYDADGKLQEP